MLAALLKQLNKTSEEGNEQLMIFWGSIDDPLKGSPFLCRAAGALRTESVCQHPLDEQQLWDTSSFSCRLLGSSGSGVLAVSC